MTPNSRSTMIQWCLRKLGAPVIELNLDDTQIDDRVDEALDLFTQFHTDAVEKKYLALNVTANVMSNQYFVMPNNVMGVSRIFPLSTIAVNSNQTGGFNMFDISYQLRLNEMFDMTSADYVYFELANQHLATLEMLFTGQVPIRYNRYTNILYTDLNWHGDIAVGNYVIAECYTVIDPNNSLFWNDNWLKRYVTALLKRQWGANLKKFRGIKLPGGVYLDGQELFDEATKEQDMLEIQLRERYETAPEWFVG